MAFSTIGGKAQKSPSFFNAPDTYQAPSTKAMYHITTSVLGPPAVAALPLSFAYLGWAGGSLLLIISAVVSFYSGYLLISLQEDGQRTYSEIADSTMGSKKFSHYYVRPFQMIIFFTTSTLVVLLISEFLQALIDLTSLSNNHMSPLLWIIISGVIVMAITVIPSLSDMWQLSLTGTITALTAIGLFVFGIVSSIADGSNEDVDFKKPETDNGSPSFAFGILLSFGTVAFAFGGHSVLPDVQASLVESKQNIRETQRAMKRGLCWSYGLIVVCYTTVSALGYAAFGSAVSPFVVEDFSGYISPAWQTALYILLLVNIIALGAVYIQAAFVLLEDIFAARRESQETSQEVSAQIFHPMAIVRRVLFLSLCTFTAAALPFFGDLAALSGAIGFTPLTFVYPYLFWNQVHKDTAPKWKLRLHSFLAASYTLAGTAGAIGALYFIVIDSSSYQLFQHS